MIQDNPSDSFATAPIPATGPLPKHRLTDARKAQQIYWNTHEANRARNAYGAYLQGINDGNNPYRQSSLRNSGQGWRANFPTMEAKARKSTAKTPYYDLFASGPTYCDVRTAVKGPDLDADTASAVITDEFHELQRSWAGFDFNFWKMLDDFVGYGRGWLYRPTAESWHFKRIPWWRVRFPDGTDVDPETWEMFTIEHVFDPVNLNAYLRDSESAKAGGWNATQVRRALLDATPLDPDNSQDQMLVQQMIRDQDVGLMYRTKTVQAASVYVKEWSGKWSRMIIQIGKDKNTTALATEQWLYYKPDVAENVNQILSPFFFEVETGSINGVSGLLRDIVDQVKVRNRMICEMVNNGFLRSTVLMQAANASSRVKGSLITVGGGVTLLPEGMDIQQSSILGDIQSAMEVSQVIEDELDKNTGVFRPQMEKPQGNPEPLGTTQLRYAQSAVLQNSAVNRFQTSCDWFYAENYRRASMDLAQSEDPGIKSALEFQRRCRARGVSDEQLRNVESVRAVRVIGNGSPGMRQQLTAEIAQFLPVLGLGQRGIRNFGHMLIAARGGQDMVDRLMPPEDEADLPSEQDREAMQENGMVKIGVQVMRIENDNDMVHLRRHFEAGFAAMQAAQQGGDPNEGAAFIQGILPHVYEHIQNLRNPSEQKEAVKVAKQLEQGLAELVSAIQQSTPDPGTQQQMMSDMQMRQFETQAKIEDRNVKTAAAMQDKVIKTRFGMQLQAQQARQDMALKDVESAQDIILSARDMKIKEAQAQAKSQPKPKAK